MKKKIMVVDDEPDQVYTIQQFFEFSGKYEVIGANSGMECVEVLKNEKKLPDLILLDIMMPEKSGWDVFAQLKEKTEWREIPIIFLTALTDEYSKGFGSISADDYIEKPYDLDELKKRIEKVLNKTKKKKPL
ncbi:response regulator with CheY-like receiver domain and winged-helix DNA-binding domain [Thermoplasmatales archaeon SCGC AB-540-F20]|nr:response regulator with CheY-like receiver domain and winged-helix DNA-binding domain [Thermoplasmatales archaeon SCGC AB-540-F20]